MPSHSQLLSGEIVFDDDSSSFEYATVHVFLEDTTLADASAKVVVHFVMDNVSVDSIQGRKIPFTLLGTIPDKRARYTVRVHVDVDGTGRISHGDYINTVSYPVLTRGYPDRVTVHVNRVQ